MSPDTPLTRRRLMVAGTAAGSLAALAACAPATTPAAPAAAAPPPTGGTPVRVGKLSDVAVGGTASGRANGKSVLLFRPDQTTVLAYSAVCPHAACTVAAMSQEFDCPCHGSTFRPADGSVISGPARRPLTRFAAAIDGEWITVSV
ncbi:MAG TPA: Rieske (2Fe-2S) protein [Micrococcaceae bacterium]|nr:Rieske (2Fe-2S) protein [Micrococcaceae bacterium]